jgi:hypothetical protein
VVNAGTWSRLSKAATLDTRLLPQTLRVLAVLGAYADANGYCYPAVGTIAAALGRSDRMVQRHMRVLEALGYVKTYETKRLRGGGFASNHYQLLYPPPPSLARPGNSECNPGGHHPSAAVPKRTGGRGNDNASMVTPHVTMASPVACKSQAETPSMVTSGDLHGDICVQSMVTPGVTLTNPDINKPRENKPRESARDIFSAMFADYCRPSTVGEWVPELDPNDPTDPRNKQAPQDERQRLTIEHRPGDPVSDDSQRQAESEPRPARKAEPPAGGNLPYKTDVPLPAPLAFVQLDPHAGLKGTEREFSERLEAAQGDLAARRAIMAEFHAWETQQAAWPTPIHKTMPA